MSATITMVVGESCSNTIASSMIRGERNKGMME